MYFDGSKMLSGMEASIVLVSSTGDMMKYVRQIIYTDSNNIAE